MGIDLGGFGTGVAEEDLDVAKVGAVFEEVGGEAVSETVDRDVFGHFGDGAGAVEDFFHGSDAEVAAFLAFEEPGVGVVHFKVGEDELAGFFGEEGIAVFAAFTAADEDDVSIEIDVRDFQLGDFADAEAA